MKANIVTLLVIVLGMTYVGIHYAHQPWTPMRIAAVTIGLPSLVLLIVARIELGASFSVRPKAQALVTHGLYSRIRHPIYVFGVLTVAAFLLYVNKPLALCILVVIVPLQIYRARQEEKYSRPNSKRNTVNIGRARGCDFVTTSETNSR